MRKALVDGGNFFFQDSNVGFYCCEFRFQASNVRFYGSDFSL